jgi:hypothetical protein
MTPAWILDVLAAVMLVVAAVSAARIAAARPWRREGVLADADVAHLLMAIAMAGMAAPGLGTLPAPAWEAVSGLLIAWFASRLLADARRNGIRALAGGHCAPHLVHSGSMLYMFLAASSPVTRTSGMSGMSGMSGGAGSAAMALSHPTLGLVFGLVLVGYGIWDLDQLSGRRYATGAHVSLAEAGPLSSVVMPVMAGAAQAAEEADHAVETAGGHAAASRGGGAAGAGAPHPGGGFLLSPAVTVGCRITMSVAMAFLLLIAL